MAANLEPEVKASCDKLESLIGSLPPGKQEFAKGLIHSTRTFGATFGRTLWLGKLIEMAEEHGAAPATPAADATVNVGPFNRVFALFRKANEKLQKPRIRMLFADRKTLVLQLADKGKYVGRVIVSDDTGYGGKFYGLVDHDGNWTKGHKAYPESEQLEPMLQKLADDPAGVAREYGKLTGRCCFCNLKLTDPQSTAAGYGPVCAKNYGLADERIEALPVLENFEGEGTEAAATSRIIEGAAA